MDQTCNICFIFKSKTQEISKSAKDNIWCATILRLNCREPNGHILNIKC